MKSRYTRILLVGLAAGLVAGCGGGGGGGGYDEQTPPKPANSAPKISALADQATDEGATLGPLSFTVSDAESDASALTVVATSSDTTLIPPGGLEVGGAGATRTLTITPASEGAGNAEITITVTDANGGSGNGSFKLAVNALLSAQFSSWARGTVMSKSQDASAVGEAPEERQVLPRVEDINRIRIQDDTAENPKAYDDLLPPPEPTEGSV
jgi:hypothetical protein